MQAAAASLNGTVSHRELAGMSDDDGVTLRQSTAAGTISAEVLQHPMSGRAAKMISHAMNQAHRGDHLKAITELQLALKERSAVPYAHSLLGSEYLKTNQVPAALEQLTEAVKLLPRDPANHANLGYALFLMGQLEAGEAQVLTALAEDQHNAQTRSLLQQMRRIRGESGVGEASVK
jgi:Flp pilus assembly protein TadD